ncbi:MAG: hypothetical protein WC750_06265 [Patescibacteria group bacterium]
MKKKILTFVLVMALLFSAIVGTAELMNITTAGVDGNWVIYDANKNIICTFDAANRKLSFPSGSTFDVESGGALKIAGTQITPTAAQFNFLAGAVAGSAVNSKAVIRDSSGNVGTLKAASVSLGTSGAETAVTATGTELNFLAGATAGTPVANKAVIANANTNIGIVKATQLHIGTSGAETQITATPAQLNRAGTQKIDCGTTSTCGNTNKSNVALFYSGSVTATAGSAVVSGLSPGFTGTNTYSCVVASNDNTGAIPWYCANTGTDTITLTSGSNVTMRVSYILMGY